MKQGGNNLADKKIGFLGAGNMATALWKGILHLGDINKDDVYIYDPLPEKQEQCTAYGIHVCANNRDVVYNSQYIFLCVKPQVSGDVLAQLRDVDFTGKVLVSICAGVTIETIRTVLGRNIPVVRAMPNTPLLLGEGMTALTCPPDVDTRDFNVIRSLFDASGKTVVVKESDLSAVTAVSGSGPAYCFKLARAVVEEGVALGLFYETALALFSQTMRGSAAMLSGSGCDPTDLINMVTSPKGTTLAASEVFDANEFEPVTRQAVRACFDRAQELAGQ